MVDAWEGAIGAADLTEASGVAAYTSPSGDRRLMVADGASDEVKIFGGSKAEELELRRTLSGPKAGEEFVFGDAGAYLAMDPGNADDKGECVSVADQACTAGHFLVYDAGQNAIEEFDASGEFLDRFSSPELTDAKPTAMAVDRSGGENDGTIYVSAGGAADAQLLAFAPLSRPRRAPLETQPPSRVQEGAGAVETGFAGHVYLGVGGTQIRVLTPDGEEVSVGTPAQPGLGYIPTQGSIQDLAVDSEGNVYVVEADVRVVLTNRTKTRRVMARSTHARNRPSSGQP